MQALANFLMRSRLHAGLSAMVLSLVAIAIPLFFAKQGLGVVAVLASLLCTGTVALTLFRQGLNESVIVIFWALVPAIALAISQQQSEAFFGLVMDMTAVVVLSIAVARNPLQWEKGVIALLPVVLGLSYFSRLLVPDFDELLSTLTAEANKFLAEFLSQSQDQLSEADLAPIKAVIPSIVEGILLGGMAAGSLLAGVMGMAMGRILNASLMAGQANFVDEFALFRMPRAYVAVFVALLFLMNLSPVLGVAVFVLMSVPLFFAGFALMRGIFARLGIPVFLVLVIYVVLVLSIELAYPLLVVMACIDSFVKFDRVRVQGPRSDSHMR